MGNNVVTIIVGLDKFSSEVEDSVKTEIFGKLNETEKCSFIIVDTNARLK